MMVAMMNPLRLAGPEHPLTEQQVRLVDAEVAALDESNKARLEAINAQGKLISGIDTHMVQSLVELLLPLEAIAVANLNHQRWLAATLDEIEANLRKRVFTDLSQPGA